MLKNSAILQSIMADDKPITKTTLVETLNEYGEKVLFPQVGKIVDNKISNLRKDLPQIVTNAMKPVVKGEFTMLREENQKWKREMLKSNDKVIKELEPLREEQKAIDENYKKLDERMDNVKIFAEEAAEIVGVEFKKG